LGKKKRKRKAKKLKEKAASNGSRPEPGSKPAARIPEHRAGYEVASAGAPGIRKQPRQRRSVDMVEAVLQAAAELFAELGYARTTTNKIAERAGVSVGSLYQYFANKDSLLASLLAKHHAEVHEVVGQALGQLANPATSLDQGLRGLLENLVALHEANPALTKSLSAAVLRQSSVGDAQDKVGHDDEDVAAVIALLANRPDVRQGDYAAMAAVLGQTTAQLTRWLVHDAPASLDREALVEEITILLARFLRESS
jgi:AcrR family transcriptional regulator